MLSSSTKLALATLFVSAFSYANEKPDEDNHHKKHQNKEHHEQEEHHDHHEHSEGEVEKIQVRASRLSRVVNESATRTEIINGEEIQEKAIMRPGNISMLVAETGGVRVQTTSPALGSANIRLQGLYGRYTQLLNDGLPLFGGQTASIGLLQIPPTDLANVEIIKGSASSLYGGSALGGVINLISRTPSQQAEGEVLVNATSQNGQDLTSYLASPLSENFKGSVTAGLHNQQQQDLDNDGWLDIAGYERGTLRPRLYWQGEEGENLYITMGLMSEKRQGGTEKGAVLANGESFIQNQDSNRLDIGVIYDQSLTENLNLNVRGSVMDQQHEHQYGIELDEDTHNSYLLESSVSGYKDSVAWLVGAALQTETYSSNTHSEFDYTYNVPGVFSQLDYEFDDETTMSVSARSDWHSEYGHQFSPRVSVLYNPDNWSVRGAYGLGYFAPTPFIEDIEDAGLSRLAPLSNIEEEHASTASVDIGYVQGSVETSVTLFASDIEHVTELQVIDNNQASGPQVQLVNTQGQTEIRGAELLLRYRWRDIKFTGSYLYTDATKYNAEQASREPLTLNPTHSAGMVVMWEEHGSHIVGFEAYYTGEQELENNPYRQKSEPYWHLGLLGQITLGSVSYFINAENLLDVRQTKEDSLLLTEQAQSGRWTTDIWSRNDGLVFNAGLRYKF